MPYVTKMMYIIIPFAANRGQKDPDIAHANLNSCNSTVQYPILLNLVSMGSASDTLVESSGKNGSHK